MDSETHSPSAPEPKKILLVVNPGSRSAERLTEPLLALRGRRLTVAVIDEPREIILRVRQAVSEDYDRVLVLGGDGTLSQAVRGLAPDFPPLELAAIPVGTGNDLARALGVGSDNLELASELAVHGGTRALDVVRCRLDGQETHFLNVANGGIGGRTAATVEGGSKALLGSFAYWIAGATAAGTQEATTVEITIDGVSRRERLIGLVIANGPFVGGGFPVAPEAKLDDGLLHVVMIPDLSTLEIITAGTRYVLDATHDDSPAEVLTAHRVELRSSPDLPFSIDGEIVTVREALFEVVPGVIRMVADDSAPGLTLRGKPRASS